MDGLIGVGRSVGRLYKGRNAPPLASWDAQLSIDRPNHLRWGASHNYSRHEGDDDAEREVGGVARQEQKSGIAELQEGLEGGEVLLDRRLQCRWQEGPEGRVGDIVQPGLPGSRPVGLVNERMNE